MSPAFHFQTLTPDTILDAIESVGIYPETGLTPLNSFENRVYQFRCDRANRYVAKFYRPERWTDKQILEEHAFAFELGEAEVPLAAPVVIEGQSLFHFEGFRFALFPSIGGRQFEMDNLDQLEAVGHFIGRLHQVGKAGHFSERETLSSAMANDALQVLMASPHVPHSLMADFAAAGQALVSAIESAWIKTDTLRLHGDLHPGNILWTPDGPGFVDLDDARSGPAVQDLWMMLAGDDNERRLQLDTLLGAYEEFCDFDTRELALIEPLRGLRMLSHMAWISRRWDDPAFPMYFPWFAEDAYWQRQIRDMQAQVAQIAEPPLSLQPF
ncbi:serine/threonine protein kinase [Shewanella sp. FJAT-52076]|uniref:serine/threonine protein kinase n=1 Tax=Shewanella sp. FJAT-52076 TaxID=2864202 RepID=UPI001C656D62|nr:serine/threonine protein kinase [Shewanella sp. FJAT-52076]QYJ75077.1 serine/threonine protein kinase [Shewanella sp. FJAT-52076]